MERETSSRTVIPAKASKQLRRAATTSVKRKSTSRILKHAKGLYLTKTRFDAGFDEEREDYELKVQLAQNVRFGEGLVEQYQ